MHHQRPHLEFIVSAKCTVYKYYMIYRRSSAIYFPEVLATDLLPRTRRVRGNRAAASTEGKYGVSIREKWSFSNEKSTILFRNKRKFPIRFKKNQVDILFHLKVMIIQSSGKHPKIVQDVSQVVKRPEISFSTKKPSKCKFKVFSNDSFIPLYLTLYLLLVKILNYPF